MFKTVRKAFAIAAMVVALSGCFETCFPDRSAPLPSAIPSTNVPFMDRITAVFEKPQTTYTAMLYNVIEGRVTYVWNKNQFSPCGVWTPQGATATWRHPDKDLGGDCPIEEIHIATITVDITVSYAFRVEVWKCSATYPHGSRPGDGPKAGPCKKVAG